MKARIKISSLKYQQCYEVALIKI